MKNKLLLLFTVMLQLLNATQSYSDCIKKGFILNKDAHFGAILNPPKGSDYSVWFPVVPSALAFDSKGNVYVGDSVKYRILKFDKYGKLIHKFSLQKPFITKKPELSHIIQDLAVDANDNIYAINLYEYRIEVYSSEGKFLKKIDYYKDSTDKKNSNSKYHPSKIAVDNNYNVYIFGSNQNLIYSEKSMLVYKGKKISTDAKDNKMIGYSGFNYEIKTFIPDAKLPGKMRDIIIVKDANNKVISTCKDLDIEIAYDENGKIYKADSKGNIYTFDYYDTLNVIKIDPGINQ